MNTLEDLVKYVESRFTVVDRDHFPEFGVVRYVCIGTFKDSDALSEQQAVRIAKIRFDGDIADIPHDKKPLMIWREGLQLHHNEGYYLVWGRMAYCNNS
jgi:hypothetical protein